MDSHDADHPPSDQRPDKAETATPARRSPDPTGISAVDSAVDSLDALESLPVEEHVGVFDDLQRRLHDALAELDDEQERGPQDPA